MLFVIYIAIGLLIGLIAEKFLKKKRISLLTCILVALIGSLSGGYLTWNLNFTSYSDQVTIGFIMSIVGGIFLIVLSYLLRERN